MSVLYRDEQFHNLNLQSSFKLLHEEFKDVFSETYKLYCLILTIPSTSVMVERNFSCLKRIKTYLRNTISQERPSGLALMSIEKKLLTELGK